MRIMWRYTLLACALFAGAIKIKYEIAHKRNAYANTLVVNSINSFRFGRMKRNTVFRG